MMTLINNFHQDLGRSTEDAISLSCRSHDEDEYDAIPCTDEEDKDSKLQQAIDEMKRLDLILASKIHKETEVKCQGKELKEKLWQELLSKPKNPTECAQVAENTRLFLALEAPIGPKEEVDFEPVFGTQVPDQEYEINTRHKEQSEKNACGTIGSSEGCQEEEGQEQSEGRYCGAPRGKKKQEDFVKKNIELASAAGGQVLMTQAEKERLAELLREMKEEEEDNARGADGEEDVWAGSIPAGLGYTPEPSNLEQLIDIDTRLQLLLPPEDFFSVRSPYINRSMSQARGLEAGWEPVGDLQPGEQVLQDVREKRGQERRLQEIQQQLEILGQGHEITYESPRLAEEQLHSLLDECELSQSWSQGLGTGDTTPWDPDRIDADGLRSHSPRLSEALLSGLLRDAYTTSFTRLG